MRRAKKEENQEKVFEQEEARLRRAKLRKEKQKLLEERKKMDLEKPGKIRATKKETVNGIFKSSR